MSYINYIDRVMYPKGIPISHLDHEEARAYLMKRGIVVGYSLLFEASCIILVLKNVESAHPMIKVIPLQKESAYLSLLNPQGLHEMLVQMTVVLRSSGLAVSDGNWRGTSIENRISTLSTILSTGIYIDPLFHDFGLGYIDKADIKELKSHAQNNIRLKLALDLQVNDLKGDTIQGSPVSDPLPRWLEYYAPVNESEYILKEHIAMELLNEEKKVH